ncbi:MAG: 2Fe-2S iron-sulfur cluster binding domain-containing protein [Alphaproteobacteria bacterium]|nr:2Fe-2S iron-sulfur cluster binding domain-containing protein [Alphaproteobacteria bacterium]
MVKLIVIDAEGAEHVLDAEPGRSVMKAATDELLPGIMGECGGCLSCATCHGYVDEAWLSRLDPPGEEELDMLSCAVDVEPNSRLTCQIEMSEALDGLVIRLPAAQF